MCDVNVQNKLEEIIDGLVSTDKLFTAFDVTKEARRQGITDRHWALKEVTHDIMSDCEDYCRTSVDINGNEAFLYHPVNADQSDIDNYLANINVPVNSQQAFALPAMPAPAALPSSPNTGIPALDAFLTDLSIILGKTPITTVQPVPAQPATNSLTSAKTASIEHDPLYKDNRGRVWIPKKLVAKVASKKNYVYANAGNNQVILSNDVFPGSKMTRVYSIDRKGNVAVSESVLKTAGLVNSKINVVEDNNMVYLT